MRTRLLEVIYACTAISGLAERGDCAGDLYSGFMGSRLPVEHTASVIDMISAPQQKVWGVITDPAAMPSGGLD